jgi:RNA polymerase sigma-70 factor (sigma-E family)
MDVEPRTAQTHPGTGQTGRLADIYVRSAPSGIRLAYLLTGDRSLAEDLVQEAFLRFVGRLRYLRDPDAFDGYLRRTVVNLARNHARRRKVEAAYVRRAVNEVTAVAREPDVDGYQAMKMALLALPERQRAAIVLRYYEDLPEADIADILRCRPATVRSFVARGLTTLRSDPEMIR